MDIRADGLFFLSQIKDAVGNDYGRPRDVAGENRYAFTSHADSAFDVCFENILTASMFNFPLIIEVDELYTNTPQRKPL